MSNSKKALSWLDTGSGGALVPPPKFPKFRKKKPTPPRAKPSSFRKSPKKSPKKAKKS